MPDVERLQAEAEDAQIRSEMARSRSQAAKSNLRELRVSWFSAKDRRSIAERTVGPLDRSRHGPIDI
jgi:hypothetical protein